MCHGLERERCGNQEHQLTAFEIDKCEPLEHLVEHEHGVDPGRGGVLDREVALVGVPAEVVEGLFVNQQFLKSALVFNKFASPE